MLGQVRAGRSSCECKPWRSCRPGKRLLMQQERAQEQEEEEGQELAWVRVHLPCRLRPRWLLWSTAKIFLREFHTMAGQRKSLNSKLTLHINTNSWVIGGACRARRHGLLSSLSL